MGAGLLARQLRRRAGWLTTIRFSGPVRRSARTHARKRVRGITAIGQRGALSHNDRGPAALTGRSWFASCGRGEAAAIASIPSGRPAQPSTRPRSPHAATSAPLRDRRCGSPTLPWATAERNLIREPSVAHGGLGFPRANAVSCATRSKPSITCDAQGLASSFGEASLHRLGSGSGPADEDALPGAHHPPDSSGGTRRRRRIRIVGARFGGAGPIRAGKAKDSPAERIGMRLDVRPGEFPAHAALEDTAPAGPGAPVALPKRGHSRDQVAGISAPRR